MGQNIFTTQANEIIENIKEYGIFASSLESIETPEVYEIVKQYCDEHNVYEKDGFVKEFTEAAWSHYMHDGEDPEDYDYRRFILPQQTIEEESISKKEELIAELQKEYEKLSSLSVRGGDGDNEIVLAGSRYKGDKNCATMAQVRFLEGLKNVDYRSTSNLLKANKWFASACISIAKEHPDFKFTIIL